MSASTSSDADFVHVWNAAFAYRLIAAAAVITGCLATLVMLAGDSTMREPLSLAQAAFVSVVIAGIVGAVRALVALLRVSEADRLIDVLLVVPSLMLLVLAVFVLPASTTAIGPQVIVWLVFALEELLWWTLGRRIRFAVDGGDLQAAASPVDNAIVQPAPADMTQRMTRRSNGRAESILIEFREQFEPAQKWTTLHAAFSPPLPSTPDVQLTQIDGPSAVLKVTQAESYGVRIEARLERRAEQDVDLLIECLATATLDADGQATGDGAI